MTHFKKEKKGEELNWCSSTLHLITLLQRAIKTCLTALQIGVFTFLQQEHTEWLKNKLGKLKMTFYLCHNTKKSRRQYRSS